MQWRALHALHSATIRAARRLRQLGCVRRNRPDPAGTVQPAPPPQPLPQSSTTNACVINCDTFAMNCSNACVVIGPTTAAAAAGSSGQCNLTCTTQQLVCKQGCSNR